MEEVLGLWPVFAHLSFFGIADVNQERIVEEGGLDALLSLLETSENTTIHRVTAGAVANLAMNGNWFMVSNKAPFRFLFNLVEMVQKSSTCSLPRFLNYHSLLLCSSLVSTKPNLVSNSNWISSKVQKNWIILETMFVQIFAISWMEIYMIC